MLGYFWEVLLTGGPGDGCNDIAVNFDEKPPKLIRKLIDGEPIYRESLSEKIIDYFANDIDINQKMAIYILRDFSGKKCSYEYLETIKMKEFKIKYKDYQ